MTGKFLKGSIVSLPDFFAALSTWVRQVHMGLPFTIIAQEPHMPTRQANL